MTSQHKSSDGTMRATIRDSALSGPLRSIPGWQTPDKESTSDDWWSLHVDGAFRSFGSGVGLLLKTPIGERLEQSIRLDFPASNNEAEYEVILSGLGLATTLNTSKVKIHNDSQLVVGQILKEYKAKDERMAKYLLKVQESLSQLGEWLIEKISRGDNVQVDALAGITASFPVKESTMLPVYVQATPTIAESHVAISQARPQNPIQASRFTLIGDDLYRRSFGGGRTLAHRAHSQGRSEEVSVRCSRLFQQVGRSEAYASIKDKDVKRFVWKNIVCRFGIPQAIIADNGPQFDSSAFKGFCAELHIKNLYSTPQYP
ncbi:hypothetical protein CK203_070334 [Vitis vinifera]|uniref:Integrase catalytic domain-containing protein n=1 Tax=Vitis vinifera TaxID=29760 RepID=A0A438E6Z0_VITVI|nr:hypothetical protein CK203_070334 [Vitis vinifera]